MGAGFDDDARPALVDARASGRLGRIVAQQQLQLLEALPKVVVVEQGAAPPQLHRRDLPQNMAAADLDLSPGEKHQLPSKSFFHCS
jgi:hypothetical protein